MVKYFVIIFSTLMSAIAQYLLKTGVTQIDYDKNNGKNILQTVKFLIFDKYIILGFSLYVIGAVLWLYVLSKFELSKAYPFASLAYFFTLIIGFLLLGESITLIKLLALLFIFIGVALMSFA
jgi:drug/metabolite transporter (DMT)-like permease